jgi:hypothetical protein
MRKAVLLTLFLGLVATAYSSPCTTGTLATYQGLADGCSIGLITYTNFLFLGGSSAGSTPTPTASQITLTPINSGSQQGFAFMYPVVTSNLVDFALQYDFDPPPAIGEAFLDLDVQGYVDIQEAICPNGNFTFNPNNPAGCFIGEIDPEPILLGVNSQANLTDFALVDPPAQTGQIRVTFELDGTRGFGPSGFDSVQATTSFVPEPATFALLLSGLLAVGLRRRKASQ